MLDINIRVYPFNLYAIPMYIGVLFLLLITHRCEFL